METHRGWFVDVLGSYLGIANCVPVTASCSTTGCLESSIRHCLRPPSGPVLTDEGLRRVECQGAPQDADNCLWVRPISRTRFISCAFLDGFKSVFALTAVVASEAGHVVKKINQKRLAPDSLIYPVPTTLPMCVSWTMFFCQDVADHLTLTGSADYHLSLLVVTTPHRRCSVANVAWDLVAFDALMLTIWVVLLCGENCTNVHSHVSLQVCRKLVSIFTASCQRKC